MKARGSEDEGGGQHVFVPLAPDETLQYPAPEAGVWNQLKLDGLYGLGALLYLVPSFGYVLYDVFTVTMPSFMGEPANALTLAMAVVLLVDALVLMLGLYAHNRPLFLLRGLDFWANASNVVGSSIFVFSQGLYYLKSSDFQSSVTLGRHWATWYLLAFLVWAVSALLYFRAYLHERRKGVWSSREPFYSQIAFYDEATNMFASVGYVCTAMYGLFPLAAYEAAAVSAANPQASYEAALLDNFKRQAAANLIFDLSWTLGGCINMVRWWRHASSAKTKPVRG